jgi:hypothetical protein
MSEFGDFTKILLICEFAKFEINLYINTKNCFRLHLNRVIIII